jgi:transposase
MLFAQINEQSRTLLHEALQAAEEAKWYRRLQVIVLSGQGHQVSEIAPLTRLSEATIRDYIKRYNHGGLSGLQPNYGIGRPAANSWTKEEWDALLHRSPCQFEKLATGARNWTQTLLVHYLLMYHQVSMSQSALSYLFKRLGISWNRGKLKVTSPDPDYQVKRSRIEALKKKP